MSKLKKYIERNCHFCRHYDETRDGRVVFPCKIGGNFGFTVDMDGKTWCVMKNKDPEQVKAEESESKRKRRRD